MLNAATLSISFWLLPAGSVLLCARTRLPSTFLVRCCLAWLGNTAAAAAGSAIAAEIQISGT
jgi:hypothetical protein